MDFPRTVVEVRIGDDSSVEIIPKMGLGSSRRYESATVTRRDNLTDNVYNFEVEGESHSIKYRGGTFLIDEVRRPYHFIVDVRVEPEDLQSDVITKNLEKVRDIVELEKPAHTVYYLKLTPVVDESALEFMQIRVHSKIGVDTTVG